MPPTYRLTPTEHVEITEESPAVLAVEATYLPGSSRPPGHLHPEQDEHFEVLADHRDVFRLSAGPRPLIGAVLAALAPLGRRRLAAG